MASTPASSRSSRGRSRSASTRSTWCSAATACSAAGRRRSRSRSPSPACARPRTGSPSTSPANSPAGTECPGHLGLRTTFKVATPRRRKPPRIHAVTRSLGQRTFHLTGRELAPLRPAAHRRRPQAAAERGKLRTELIAAIPGGVRTVGPAARIGSGAPPGRARSALVAERLAQARDLAFEVEQIGFEPVEPRRLVRHRRGAVVLTGAGSAVVLPTVFAGKDDRPKGSAGKDDRGSAGGSLTSSTAPSPPSTCS